MWLFRAAESAVPTKVEATMKKEVPLNILSQPGKGRLTTSRRKEGVGSRWARDPKVEFSSLI